MLTIWPALIIDRHLLAAISLTGMVFDVLGGLYLAYDLLGGAHGPLRLITRTVTYIILFTLGYGLSFGPFFGVVVGIGFGLVLGVEYNRRRHEQNGNTPVLRHMAPITGVARGVVLGIAAGFTFGRVFGLAFGALSGGGLVVLNMLGFAPATTYEVEKKPSIRREMLIASGLRCCTTGSAGLIAGLLTGEGWLAVLLGLKVGLVVGLVSVVIGIMSPMVEWWADRLPLHRLGVLGTLLLLCGFVLQSLQYWAMLLNIAVR